MSATVLDMSMSLDGFVAGPNEGPGKGSATALRVEVGAGGDAEAACQSPREAIKDKVQQESSGGSL